MRRPTMLYIMPLVLMEQQDVIREAAVYNMLKLSEKYDITFATTMKKEQKILEEKGILQKLVNNGIEVVHTAHCYKVDGNYLTVDMVELEKLIGMHDMIYSFACCCGDQRKLCNSLLESMQKLNESASAYSSYCSSLGQVKRIVPLLFLTSRGCKNIIQYCVDWTETSLIQVDGLKDCKIKQLGHYSKHSSGWETQHSILYEEYLDKNLTKRVDKSKPIDFIFGFTVLFANRQKIYEKIMSIENALLGRNEIYVKHNKLKIDSTVPQKKYLARVAKAKVSLIIPSYLTTEFSYMRFAECVSARCIPLIYSPDDKYLNGLKRIFLSNGWQELFEWYWENELIVDNSTLSTEKVADTISRYDELMPKLVGLYKNNY